MQNERIAMAATVGSSCGSPCRRVGRSPSDLCLLPSAFCHSPPRPDADRAHARDHDYLLTVAALGMMSRAVEISAEFSQGYGTARNMTADARSAGPLNESGVRQRQLARSMGDRGRDRLVEFSRYAGSLAAQRHAGQPSRATLVSELVLFCLNRSATRRFLGITFPGDCLCLPLATHATTFKSFVDGLKTAARPNKVLLTDPVCIGSGKRQRPATRRSALCGDANPYRFTNANVSFGPLGRSPLASSFPARPRVCGSVGAHGAAITSLG